MFSRVREDIQSVFDRDPAARTSWEVLTCYPGVHAMIGLQMRRDTRARTRSRQLTLVPKPRAGSTG